jgi:transcriptional regulator with XRE-family HTH domain
MAGPLVEDRAPTARNLAHVTRDRGYRFVDRDPVLDEVARMIIDSGLSVSEIIERIEAISDTATVSYSTIANWLSGKTKRPQNYTVTWVALALGYTRTWSKTRGRR